MSSLIIPYSFKHSAYIFTYRHTTLGLYKHLTYNLLIIKTNKFNKNECCFMINIFYSHTHHEYYDGRKEEEDIPFIILCSGKGGGCFSSLESRGCELSAITSALSF